MLRLRTLGGAALVRDGVPLDAVGAQRKSLALLALLAVSRGHGISRERVASYLWPESATERSRGALKQALHALRRQLGSGDAIIGTAELRLNPEYIGSDVDAFLGALEAGNLELAAELYSGPFLDGFHLPHGPEFEAWVSAQRDEFAHRYASALERLAADAEGKGDRAAIPWLRRLLATDPLSARVTLRLMRALDASGERGAALRFARVHDSLLREELESPPDPEVAALADVLRAEAAPAEPRRVARPPQAASSTSEAAAPGSAAPAGALGPSGRGARRQAMRWRYVAVPVVALIVVAAIAPILRGLREPGIETARGLPADRSVAVLLFSSLSGDSATRHLSNGITNEVSTELNKVPGLRVASRAVTDAAGKGVDVRALADTLGVATVLDGTVWRGGDHLKVTARLVDARSNRVLWSERYDGEVRDIFAIQAALVHATIDALHVRQPLAERARIAPPTMDPEAYELYLRARYSWTLSPVERLKQAAVYYQGAIERDPAFALAYAGLAETYANLSNFGVLAPGEGLARAGVEADRALALDSGLAEAHTAKAVVLMSKQEFQPAEAAFRRAIALNPTYAWARHYYALLLLMLGRTDEALEQNGHALAAEAHSLPANATRGIILLQRGDSPGAERELRKTLALSPSFSLISYYLAVLRAAQGDYAEAGRLLEQTVKGPAGAPAFTGVPGARAFVLERTGQRPAAAALLRDLQAQANAGGERARVNLAFADAALGRMDEAFSLFDQVKWDIPSLVELRADPLLEPLRSDPRYPALLRRIGVGR